MLLPGEEILSHAEAYCKVGFFRELAGGRVCLTTQRLIWLRRSPWIVGLLFFWAPKVLAIPLSSIEGLSYVRRWGVAWISIKAAGKGYVFRMGKGPYPLLRDHIRTTEEWFHAIEDAKARLSGDTATV